MTTSSTARKPIRTRAACLLGVAVAVVSTLFDPRIQPWGYAWVGAGVLVGSVVGATMGLRIPMTAVPQRTALSHSLGALAATLVGIAEYVRHHNAPDFGARQMLPRAACRRDHVTAPRPRPLPAPP